MSSSASKATLLAALGVFEGEIVLEGVSHFFCFAWKGHSSLRLGQGGPILVTVIVLLIMLILVSLLFCFWPRPCEEQGGPGGFRLAGAWGGVVLWATTTRATTTTATATTTTTTTATTTTTTTTTSASTSTTSSTITGIGASTSTQY